MNMSKFPDREDIDLLSSDKIVKTYAFKFKDSI